MKNRLPDFILEGEKKGFFSPIAKWLRTEFGNFLLDRVITSLSDYSEINLISPKKINQMYREHLDTRKYWTNELFGIFSILEWYKNILNSSYNHPEIID